MEPNTKFNLEGNINRDKVLKIFDLLDLMNIEETANNPGSRDGWR